MTDILKTKTISLSPKSAKNVIIGAVVLYSDKDLNCHENVAIS